MLLFYTCSSASAPFKDSDLFFSKNAWEWEQYEVICDCLAYFYRARALTDQSRHIIYKINSWLEVFEKNFTTFSLLQLGITFVFSLSHRKMSFFKHIFSHLSLELFALNVVEVPKIFLSHSFGFARWNACKQPFSEICSMVVRDWLQFLIHIHVNRRMCHNPSEVADERRRGDARKGFVVLAIDSNPKEASRTRREKSVKRSSKKVSSGFWNYFLYCYLEAKQISKCSSVKLPRAFWVSLVLEIRMQNWVRLLRCFQANRPWNEILP